MLSTEILQTARTLTVAFREKYFVKLVARDGGLFCFYCKAKLSYKKHVFEHLNDNREDNRMENIVLACQSCNNKKPHNDSMKEKALGKLAENESNVLCERKFEKRETTPEINTNEVGLEMAEEYLEEKLKENKHVDYSDTLSSITYRIYKKLGHSSEVTVARHIKTLCCSEAPYEIVKEDKERKITKKKGVLGGRGEVKRVAKRKENLVPVNALHYMLINREQSNEFSNIRTKQSSYSKLQPKTILHVLNQICKLNEVKPE